jgi:hypothetical protein
MQNAALLVSVRLFRLGLFRFGFVGFLRCFTLRLSAFGSSRSFSALGLIGSTWPFRTRPLLSVAATGLASFTIAATGLAGSGSLGALAAWPTAEAGSTRSAARHHATHWATLGHHPQLVFLVRGQDLIELRPHFTLQGFELFLLIDGQVELFGNERRQDHAGAKHRPRTSTKWASTPFRPACWASLTAAFRPPLGTFLGFAFGTGTFRTLAIGWLCDGERAEANQSGCQTGQCGKEKLLHRILNGSSERGTIDSYGHWPSR